MGDLARGKILENVCRIFQRNETKPDDGYYNRNVNFDFTS